jgi:hypothetical protein
VHNRVSELQLRARKARLFHEEAVEWKNKAARAYDQAERAADEAGRLADEAERVGDKAEEEADREEWVENDWENEAEERQRVDGRTVV